jgi:CheY-like chemotaxis protein
METTTNAVAAPVENPVLRAQDAALPTQPQLEPQSVQVGRAALLVDNGAWNTSELSKVLDRRGMSVLANRQGNEAVGIAQARSDILVIPMDIMMPGMDSDETIEVRRMNPPVPRLPIVAPTAKATPVNTEQLPSAQRMWRRR